MEIVNGKIMDVHNGKLIIEAPYSDWHRFCHREYEDVQIGIPDGRTITPKQRAKAYALIGEISEWMGEWPNVAKKLLKVEFVVNRLQALDKKVFSLSSKGPYACDETTAREFITYLIDFILENDVPTQVPLYEQCEDVGRYVYACLIHKKCAVCGKKADLHHVDRVGMGGDREHMNHIGMECLPLCGEHHKEAHRHGDQVLLDRYHLQPVKIDNEIAKVYRLSKKGKKPTTEAQGEHESQVSCKYCLPGPAGHECDYHQVSCPYQEYDYNPDQTVNMCMCTKDANIQALA